MNDTLASMKKMAPTCIAVGVAIASAGLFSDDVYADVTQELIAFFGLMVAAVLPAMTLTATALKSGRLSKKRLISLHAALRQQLLVWLGMFSISIFLCSLIVIGKINDWSLHIPFSFGGIEKFNFAKILVFLISGGLTLFILRVGAIGKGILSILEVSREVALSEIEENDTKQMDKIRGAALRVSDPPKRGAYVDLPRH